MAYNPWVNPNPDFNDLWNARPGQPAPAPTAPPLPPINQGPPAGGPGGIPGGSDIIGTGTIPGYGQANSQLATTIQKLLNPNDPQANYDVTLHGAERAIAGGIPGSGLAAETTGRMRQADIERRAALGTNLLMDQEGMDLKNKLASGQLTLEQLRLALQEKVQLGQLSLEGARLLFNNLHGGYGGYGGYGGSGNMPRYPTTAGAPSTGAYAPSFGGGGVQVLSTPGAEGSWVARPPIEAPDNWSDLTALQQGDYAAQYRANPYNYGAPNPYEGDGSTLPPDDDPYWYL